MTVYRVEPTGADGALRSLNAAARVVVSGDEVVVAPGIYRESLNLRTPGVLWRSEERHAAVIDGGWSGRDFDDKFSMAVGVGAAGIVFDGFGIRNCEGRALVAGEKAQGSVLRHLRIDNCGTSAFVLTGAVEVTVEDVIATRLGMAWEAGRRDSVSGSVIMTDAQRCVVRRCVVLYGWGEGINCGRGCDGCVVEACVVGDCAHLAYYINNAVGCSLIGNVAFQSGWTGREVGEGAPAGIVIGDEGSRRMQSNPDSARSTVRGNVVVDCGVLFHVRNNRTNYDTVLDGQTVIENNTLVGGPLTRVALQIDPNEHGGQHGAAVIAGNVVDLSHAPGAVAARGGAGLRWRGNAWSVAPPAYAQSATDVIGNVGLARPDAPLANEFPAEGHTLNLDNYRPLSDSRLVGAGENGRTIGALEPAIVPVPPEPPLDWAALIARVGSVGVQLATLAEAMTIIQEQIAITSLASDAAAEELARLLEQLAALSES